MTPPTHQAPPGSTQAEEEEYYSLTQKFFSRLAPLYDLFTWPVSRLREEVVDFAGARKGSRVLDVATGTGAQAFAFARRGFDVVGVDISEDMLRVARRKNIYPHLRLALVDATTLPLRDGDFDVSVVSMALHDMPAGIRERVLREMVRCTRRGGTIVVTDYALPRNRFGRAIVYRLVRMYEGKYYDQFIHSDLEGLLTGLGIDIVARRPAARGAVRIIKGSRS